MSGIAVIAINRYYNSLGLDLKKTQKTDPVFKPRCISAAQNASLRRYLRQHALNQGVAELSDLIKNHRRGVGNMPNSVPEAWLKLYAAAVCQQKCFILCGELLLRRSFHLFISARFANDEYASRYNSRFTHPIDRNRR